MRGSRRRRYESEFTFDRMIRETRAVYHEALHGCASEAEARPVD